MRRRFFRERESLVSVAGFSRFGATGGPKRTGCKGEPPASARKSSAIYQRLRLVGSLFGVEIIDRGRLEQFAPPVIVENAHLARIGIGANVERRVICDEDVYPLAKDKSAEVRLCSRGVGTDAGGDLARFDKTRVKAMLNVYPRNGFERAFLDVLTRLSHDKPHTVYRTFVEDVAKRYVAGFTGTPDFCSVLYAAEAEFDAIDDHWRHDFIDLTPVIAPAEHPMVLSLATRGSLEKR